MLGNVRRRRRRLPRCVELNRRHESHDDWWERLQDCDRHRRRECGPRRTRLLLLRSRAAVVGRRLCELCPRRALLAVMKRTRAALTALTTRFRRRLPACTLRDGALREREHAQDRRDTSQERPHTLRMRPPGQRVKCDVPPHLRNWRQHAVVLCDVIRCVRSTRRSSAQRHGIARLERQLRVTSLERDVHGGRAINLLQCQARGVRATGSIRAEDGEVELSVFGRGGRSDFAAPRCS